MQNAETVHHSNKRQSANKQAKEILQSAEATQGAANTQKCVVKQGKGIMQSAEIMQGA